MQLQATGTRFYLLVESAWLRVVAFAGNAPIDWKVVAGLQHLANMVCAWCAGRCVCAGAVALLERTARMKGCIALIVSPWTSATTEHGCDTRADGFVCLLWANSMDMRIKATSRDDLMFSSYHVRATSDG